MNRNRFGAFLREHAQGRRRRRNTESEETQEGLGENHRWDRKRGVDDDWPERVRKNVARHDAEIGNTDAAGRLDKLFVLKIRTCP